MAQIHTKKKNLIILLTALAVGGVAAFLAQSYLRGKMEEIEARERNQATVKLVVPKASLEKGAKLSAENLAVRAVPQEWAHSGSITPAEFARVDGATLAYPINAGEPILWAELEGEHAPSFSTQLSAGRRAITVPVDEISSVSGLLEPGDLIDLIVSVRKEKQTYTFTLLQGVTVLATGQQTTFKKTDTGQKEETYNTITLDTLPEDAKRIVAAREIGRITAMLRAPGDQGRVSAKRTEAQNLLGLGDATSGVSQVPVIYGGAPIANVQPLQTYRDDGAGHRMGAGN